MCDVLCALQEVLIGPHLGTDVCTQLSAVMLFQLDAETKNRILAPLETYQPMQDAFETQSTDPAFDLQAYARSVVQVRPCLPNR